MKPKHKFVFFLLSVVVILLSIVLVHYGATSAVLDPKGIIAIKERNLIITATLLMLVIVIPVFLLTFFICLKYRASNKKADYNPDWDHNLFAEFIWWGFPCVIILVLSIITWNSSHELDPFRPLKSHLKPLKIQVVALQWKWLFIYPEQKIATINYIQFPEKVPIHFEITADAPMNSFWIPSLSGQIYAMPGMNSQLHIMANEKGKFRGSSANLSGAGFAGMTFTAEASTQEEFDRWVEKARSSDKTLGVKEYKKVALLSEYDPVVLFALKDDDLYHQILMKYMSPMSNMQRDDTEDEE